jgi:hypothetical protein
VPENERVLYVFYKNGLMQIVDFPYARMADIISIWETLQGRPDKI